MDSIIEADQLHGELRILDWILYQVCSNEKQFKGIVGKLSKHVIDSRNMYMLLVNYCWSTDCKGQDWTILIYRL